MAATSILDVLLGIAAEAGDVVRRVYATDFAVEYKGPKDPVTLADREANALVCERLARAFPGVPVVAEESDESAYDGWTRAPRAFFVDPLDGTREFVDRNGEFAVMIGLADDGVAVAGVVLAPALGTAWIGAAGEGAWEVSTGGASTPIRVSATDRLDHARVVVTRSHRGRRLDRALAAIGPGEVVPCGGAGIKGARVASGAADLYAQPAPAGKRWEACSPNAIVRAAGGVYTDLEGAPIAYRGPGLDNDRGILCSNAALHRAAVEALRGRRGD